jgi:hypothetical protein
MLWTEAESPRIWRHVGTNIEAGGLYFEADAYTDAVLAGIAAEGFTGVWLFCLLYDLMDNRVFPELNRPGAAEKLAAIQRLIDRARPHGIRVYLYFNDPVGVNIHSPFWQAHPELQGVEKWSKYALCTSQPIVQAFFRDAVQSAMAPLRDLGGVILITACEDLTHCWSKTRRRFGDPPPTCPRCREREPAELILELLESWAAVRNAHPTPFRILAWNWEWMYYYENPQAEIVARLPEGVELLLGYDMGGTTRWQGRDVYVGEYALSYVGPGEQFLATLAVAGATPVHAKIELNNTHELASVPNVPVLATLHRRFADMTRLGVAGFLGCWSMGSRRTLNTHALRLFLQDPSRYQDEEVYLDVLARDYFGLEDTADAVRAWRVFSDAYTHYPFAVPVLYNGPHNDAPGRALSLHYLGKPIGRSWGDDPFGDDLTHIIDNSSRAGVSTRFTLEDIIAGYTRLCDAWDAGVALYAAALEDAPLPSGGEGTDQERRRREELAVATMIGIQLRSTANVYRFWGEVQRVIAAHNLTPPCTLPRDPALLALMAEEIANVERALPVLTADPRLGYHQDTLKYKYDLASVTAKLAAMRAEVAGEM